MNRRSILTLLGFSTLLKAAEGRTERVVAAAQSPRTTPLPVDAVKTASLLLQDVQSVFQELTNTLLVELNGIPEIQAEGLHFARNTYGSGSQWRPRPMGGIHSELHTCIDVHKQGEPASFAHLELQDSDGSVRLKLFTIWLPGKPIEHPLWESCRFSPMMTLKRKPVIQ